MKKVFFSAGILSLVLLSACNNRSAYKTTDLETVADAPAAIQDLQHENARDIPMGSQQSVLTDSVALPSSARTDASWDSKIIKTASLKLEVADFKKYNDVVYKTVKQYGGYIAQEDQRISAEKNESLITIKVPVFQFEEMMKQLPEADAKIIERKINTDDVSSKMVDIKSRLEAKKAMRLKYLEFFKGSKNMEEVLQVQAEINTIQEQIEAAAGQANYYTHQAAMSTINLSFYQPLPGFEPAIIEKPSFTKRIFEAFSTGGAWLANLFVSLISIWPLMLIIITGIFFWRKFYSAKLFANTADISAKK